MIDSPVDLVLQCIKTACGVWILAGGLSKLGYPRTKPIDHLPRWVESNWTLSVRFVAAAEVVLAALLFLSPPNSLTISIAFGAFAVFVTIFGLISIKETGECGCSVAIHVTTKWKFLGRNFVVFAAIILSHIFGPQDSLRSLDLDTNSQDAIFGLTVAIAPIVLLIWTILGNRSAQTLSPN